jgi:hypothetical protein
MRVANVTAILVLLCAPLAAQRIGSVPTPATVVEMAPATPEELAATAVTPPFGAHEERQRPALAAPRALAPAIVADVVVADGNAIAAPPVTRGFRASFDPRPGAVSETPADASGATGPHHVVGAFNSSLSIHDRNGTQLSLVSMSQFWHDPQLPDLFPYDPRVIYDAVNDRWVIAMLGDVNERQGMLFIAVSASGDPTATWRRFRIALSTDPAIDGDFTRLAMTADQIVITLNTWIGDVSEDADVFTITKNSAYSATLTPSVTKTSHFFDVGPVTSTDATVRLVEVEAGEITVYPPGSLNGTRYVTPVSMQIGAIPCEQSGSTQTVECGNLPLQYAVMRDGTLWVVHGTNDGSRNDVAVWKIAGGAAKVFILHDAAADAGFPSIAVNRYGAALVGYSMLDASMFPSAAYRYIDPAGNVSAPVLAKSGEDWYQGFRWGDYSTTLVDPADDTSFWTLECYMPAGAMFHQGWATWWSYVQVKVPQRTRAVRH